MKKRQNRLGDYIRHRARPRRYATATDEAKARPTLTEIGELSGLGKRRLDHKLARRANWTPEEVNLVGIAIGGDVAHMLHLKATDGHARGKPGNPNGWRQAHEARKKTSSNGEEVVDAQVLP